MVAGQTGARVVKLPLGADRLPDIASLSALITPRSRVLAIGQMSNVTGGCPTAGYPPCSRRRDGGDGRWRPGAVHFPADVQALDIDFTPFPAISCMARPGSAPCTAKASCWQRCRPARRRENDRRGQL